MLTEFQGVMQERGVSGRRRWFEDDAMQLIVWSQPDGTLTGFQICYPGEDRRERALTWRAGQGFSHASVDSGDTRPDKNLTPILVADGVVPWERVRTQFEDRAARLEAPIRDFVRQAFAGRNA
jgi:hypothetical protein